MKQPVGKLADLRNTFVSGRLFFARSVARHLGSLPGGTTTTLEPQARLIFAKNDLTGGFHGKMDADFLVRRRRSGLLITAHPF